MKPVRFIAAVALTFVGLAFQHADRPAPQPPPTLRLEINHANCPRCGGELKHNDGQAVGSQIVFPVFCPACGWSGHQWCEVLPGEITD